LLVRGSIIISKIIKLAKCSIYKKKPFQVRGGIFVSGNGHIFIFRVGFCLVTSLRYYYIAEIKTLMWLRLLVKKNPTTPIEVSQCLPCFSGTAGLQHVYMNRVCGSATLTPYESLMVFEYHLMNYRSGLRMERGARAAVLIELVSESHLMN
jgi:hypothetical protein